MEIGDKVIFHIKNKDGIKPEQLFVTGEMLYSNNDVFLLSSDTVIGMPSAIEHCIIIGQDKKTANSFREN